MDPQKGKGVLGFANGNMYNGQWLNGCFDGYGEYAWSDGRKYKGYFREGKMHGKGEFLWPDGRKFEGEFNMDMAHGHGIVVLGDGRVFEGEFSNDYPKNGQITECNGDTYSATFDGMTYVSEWKPLLKVRAGKFETGWRTLDHVHTFREFVWSDGRRFAGTCIGYCPSIGVLTERNGDQYAVSFTGEALFVEEPSPIVKMRLTTQARPFVSPSPPALACRITVKNKACDLIILVLSAGRVGFDSTVHNSGDADVRQRRAR